MSRDLKSALLPVGATPSTILGLDAAGAPEALSAADARTRMGVDLLRWRGAWDVGTAYVAGDGVTSGGSTWRALQSVTGGSAPSEGATWTVAAAKGSQGEQGDTGPSGDALAWQGAWDVGTSYTTGDTVTSGGSTWRALRSVSSGGSAPTAGADWAVVAAKGDTGATGPEGPEGPEGPPGSGTTYTIDWTTGTATNGNGTATITSSTVVTLSMASGATAGYASGTYTAPRVRVPMPSGVTKTAFRVTLRLASFTNKTSTTTPCILLESTGAAASKFGLYLAGTTIGSQNFVSAAGITSGTPASVPLYDGDDWVQLTVRGGVLSFAFARGTGGARPASTAFRSCGAILAAPPFDAVGWDVVVLMAQSSGPPSTVTMTYDSCDVETL
jgi:hypothetical protein